MKIVAFAIAGEQEDLQQGRFTLVVGFDEPIKDHMRVMQIVPQLGESARKYNFLANETDLLTEVVGQATGDDRVWKIIYQFGQPRTKEDLKLIPEFAGAVG